MFFALWPDVPARVALARAAAGIDVGAGRRVRPENLHLTLAFLGQLDPDALQRAVGVGEGLRNYPVELVIDHAGWFARPRVAWLGPTELPSTLTELLAAHTALLRDARLPVPDLPFRPHVTIARSVDRPPMMSVPVSVIWQAAVVALVESVSTPAGVRYQPLHQWPLTGPGNR